MLRIVLLGFVLLHIINLMFCLALMVGGGVLDAPDGNVEP